MDSTFEHTAPVEHWAVPGVTVEPGVESWALPPTPVVPAMSVLQASGELVVLLGRVRADLARAAELAAATTGLECLSGQSDETLLAVVVEGEAAARQLGCVQASAAAILDDRSSYAAGSSGLSARYGHNRASYMLEDIARISNSEATRRVKVGAAMRSHLTMTGESVPAQYPAIGAAIETGDISVDCAARIMTGLDAARKHHREGDPATEMVWDDSFRAAETHLVDASTTTSPDLLQVQIVQWREALDPDGAQPREEEIRSRRGFRQGRERNGITRNTWDTTGEDTARIKAAIAESDAAATPRFVCTDDAVNTDEAEQLKTHGVALADPEHTARLLTTNQLDIPTSTPTSTGEVGCADHSTTGARRFRGTATITAPVDPTTTGVVTATTDLRSREQRHCDVMSGLFMAGLRASKNETGDARSTIEVTAVVTAADLEAGVGVGWLDGINEPVSLSTIEELACTDGIRPVLLGRSGEVLYLGPKPRLFSKSQRKSMSVRGGGFCDWTGCTTPSRQCDAHHVIPWSRGGKTDINNGVLLCPEHHRQIHRSAFTIKMVNGKPFLLAPRWLDPTQTMRALGKARYTTRNTNHMNR